jgi:hypothetical protein
VYSSIPVTDRFETVFINEGSPNNQVAKNKG